MTHSKFYLVFILKNIIKCALALVLAAVSALYFMIKIYYGDDFPWTTIFGYSDLKKLIIASLIAGIAGCIQFIFNYHRSTKLGIRALKTLRKNGYKVKINEISPDPKIPFYKINGELFYNLATYTRSMEFMLSSIKKIAKHANSKNIVINMAEVSIKQDKLERKIVKKFGNKLDKILVIDKSGKVIKLK